VIADLTAAVALVAAVGAIFRSARARLERGDDPSVFGVAAAVVGVAALASLDRGGLLRVQYRIGEGPEAGDAALVLALALLACLASAMSLGADRLARPREVPAPSALARTTGRRALLVAVGLLVIGVGLVVWKAWGSLGAARGDLSLLGLALIAAGLGSAGLLWVASAPASPSAEGVTRDELSADLLTRIAVAGALAAAVAAGVEGWVQAGSVLTRDAQALLAAALVGVGALFAAPWAVARQGLFVVALVAALAQ
jgi:hypothetical protein